MGMAAGRVEQPQAPPGERVDHLRVRSRSRPRRVPNEQWAGRTHPPGPLPGPSAPWGRSQKVRRGISAGAASRPSISASSRTSVIDAPAMSREVQYSPT